MVSFRGNDEMPGLAIINYDNASKWAMSCANKDGYNVDKDSQGTNILTGHNEDGGDVYFKILEIFEVECINAPKQPEIPAK